MKHPMLVPYKAGERPHGPLTFEVDVARARSKHGIQQQHLS